MSEVATIGITATDITGQRLLRVPAVPVDKTVRELTEELLARLGLVRQDRDGNPLAYRARLTREGRHLHGGERVGDALREQDEIRFDPRIDAGC